MRSLTLAGVAALGLAAGTLPSSAEPVTTRIEPRPFYGATVTIEHGVRVIRPLPPHDRVIINPNATPLQIDIGDPAHRGYYNGYRR
ncbi:MAG TPA: hypothetical protein VFA64_03550 [Hyphomicrobiaceae bacterium]|nr:hypothetical protein [Hyphomicrobiaceae bacterium]